MDQAGPGRDRKKIPPELRKGRRKKFLRRQTKGRIPLFLSASLKNRKFQASSIFRQVYMLDSLESAGLKVTLTELPVSSPPVEVLSAPSVRQVTLMPSVVSRVMVLAVEAVISPVTEKPISRSFIFSGISPVTPKRVIPSRFCPLKSPV